MKIQAIVYASMTGYTAQYAKMLSDHIFIQGFYS